jgi:penicillin-binding protein 1C
MPPGAGPSLPLALGGAGIRLRDLVRLYAALATDGASVPLRVQPDATPGPALPLLQRSAAELVADAITRDFPQGGPSGIAWKTGTSWGGRDAWAVGFDARSVAGIWLGRPDGTAVPGITGAATALPVLADIFTLLPAAPRAPGAEENPAPDTALEAAAAVHLLFPPPGATLSADGPIPLRAMGGRRPLIFAIDGTSLPSTLASRSAAWTPTSPGFYTITVQDADGAFARAQVRIR